MQTLKNELLQFTSIITESLNGLQIRVKYQDISSRQLQLESLAHQLSERDAYINELKKQLELQKLETQIELQNRLRVEQEFLDLKETNKLIQDKVDNYEQTIEKVNCQLLLSQVSKQRLEFLIDMQFESYKENTQVIEPFSAYNFSEQEILTSQYINQELTLSTTQENDSQLM